MPSAYVKKVAAMAGVSMKTVETFWKEAKAAAAKSYDKVTEPEWFWGTTTKIFKRKANKHLGLSLAEAVEIAKSFILQETKMNNFDSTLKLLTGKCQ